MDGVIMLVFFLYAIEGMSVGFIFAFFDFISFVFSFIAGLILYSVIGGFLINVLGISSGFANAIGFFLIAVTFEIIFNFLLQKAYKKVFKPFFSKKTESAKALRVANKWLGFLPGLLSAFILLSFVLTLVVSLPLSQFIKNAVSSSKLGGILLVSTQGFEKDLKDVFGGAATETITFLTVEPQSDAFVNLKFKTTNVTIDSKAEDIMLMLVNKERAERNLPPLLADTLLIEVARIHAKDMFARGYFSHNTPEGFSPFDRMAKANVFYTSAGENLALAPNVDLAMQGLMNSPGHKKNILSPDFRKVGIAAIDGGIYGIMFTQEFTD